LILAGILVPITLRVARLGLDLIAKRLGLIDQSIRMPVIDAFLASLLPATGVFILMVMLTLLFPEGRRLLGRSNPDPQGSRRYDRLALGASTAPFVPTALVMAMPLSLIQKWLPADLAWIVDGIVFLLYAGGFLVGLILLIRLPLRLAARGVLGASYAAVVAWLFLYFLLAVDFAITGEVL
jgi:hypothetical protein